MKKKTYKDKSKSKIKFLWYTLAIASLILFALILLSSVLDIGEKLRSKSEWLEYGFYALVVLFVVVFIIRPIVIIVKSPSLAIITAEEELSPKAFSIYKKVAKNITKHNDLSTDEILLLTSYKNNEELLVNLNYVFDKTVRKQLNGIIIHNAKIVMISTAICQSARFDMATVFAVNLKMIKELVEKCGFRPSMTNLSKLTVKIFITAMIADGLENLTLSDVLPKTSLDALSNIPLMTKILDSVIDGAANALLTIRIGCVARRYLYSDGNVVTREEIRRNAYKEAVTIIPQVVGATLAFFPKKIIRFFSRKESDKNDE